MIHWVQNPPEDAEDYPQGTLILVCWGRTEVATPDQQVSIAMALFLNIVLWSSVLQNLGVLR